MIVGDSTLKILTYGLPDFEKEHARFIVSKKYGFKFFAVAGCLVSERLIDSIESQNKIVFAAMENKFGKQWYSKFNAEVEEVFKIEERIRGVVWKKPFMIFRQKELEKEGNGLFLIINPMSHKNLYEVKAYGWGTWNGTNAQIIYYRLIVDLTKNKVIQVNEKQEKFY